jgi:hypothetical protein
VLALVRRARKAQKAFLALSFFNSATSSAPKTRKAIAFVAVFFCFQILKLLSFNFSTTFYNMT